VPKVTNQPLSEARKLISGAQLTVGNIDNPTGVTDETKLIVSWQSLTAGTQVDMQSRMDLRVTSTTVGLTCSGEPAGPEGSFVPDLPEAGGIATNRQVSFPPSIDPNHQFRSPG